MIEGSSRNRKLFQYKDVYTCLNKHDKDKAISGLLEIWSLYWNGPRWYEMMAAEFGAFRFCAVVYSPAFFHSLWLTSLAPGRFQFNIRKVIFKQTLVNGGWGIPYEIALRWMSQDRTDDKSALVQVMAWCCQATSHYLSQCWPRSMSPYGVTRPPMG